VIRADGQADAAQVVLALLALGVLAMVRDHHDADATDEDAENEDDDGRQAG